MTFVPLDATRSVVFELNGSLKVESIERNGKALSGYVQDAVGVGAIGPNVRIDPVKSYRPTFLLHCVSGGAEPWFPQRRTACNQTIGVCRHEGSYLMYASRWFPFHDYAADRATSDITFIVPAGLQVAGKPATIPLLAQAVKEGAVRYHFISTASSYRKLRGRPVHKQESHSGNTSYNCTLCPAVRNVSTHLPS